jgi:antitoxin CptB
MTVMTAVSPQELGKLRWRCRRGMKELDVLLLRYVEEQFCGASSAQQEAFRALLDAPDPVIYAYCLAQERPPSAVLSSVIERITEVSAEAKSVAVAATGITQTGS